MHRHITRQAAFIAATSLLALACSNAETDPAAPEAASSSAAQTSSATATTSSAGGGAASSSGTAGGGTGGAGGATAGAGGGGAPPMLGDGGAGGALCANFSDDFDDDATLTCWLRRHEVDGTAAQYELLDMDATVAGRVVIEPTPSGWYEDDMGPLLHKPVTGDFVVEVHVAAVDEGDPGVAPVDDYHSAGLLVRDPASGAGSQNWLMYNLGYQDTFVGTEGKTTVDSTSVLTLLPGSNSGLLRICRRGSTFTMHRRLDGESDWTLEHTYDRGDLPSTLQVGMVTNAWPPAAPSDPRNLQARFDHIHLGDVSTAADCTAPIVAR